MHFRSDKLQFSPMAARICCGCAGGPARPVEVVALPEGLHVVLPAVRHPPAVVPVGPLDVGIFLDDAEPMLALNLFITSSSKSPELFPDFLPVDLLLGICDIFVVGVLLDVLPEIGCPEV